MKRFLALLATGALGLGLTASAHAQTRGFAAGAFILDDLQPTPHTIIMTAPAVGSPEWQKWQDDGFPALTMSVPVPPYDGAQAGFMPAGPNTPPASGRYMAYWIPPHATGLHGHVGGHAGSWDWASSTDLGMTTGTGTPNQITKFDGTGSAVTNSSLSDDGSTVTTASNFVIQNLLTLGSDAPVRGTIALHDATAANGFTVKLEAPDALTGNVTFKLPSVDGPANTALVTDGAGNLTFGSPVTLAGENYLTISGATITAHPVDLSGTNATGLLKSTSFPALTGDVTSAGGSLSTTVAAVGGVTAANVASGANAANAATSANTASTIVKRDASGNFSAGTITANLTGNVSGNASTASALQTARTINGVSFDGTSNINISAAPSGSAGGDLGGSYPNPSVNSVGGLTAATIAAGVNLANAATDANTASTIVKRDASGNFTAGTITANLTGNVTGDVTGNVSGNAGTATALQTPRNINGVSFDGTGDINITAPPSGSAGGDLTGSYPNPTLTTTGVTAGTYGTGTSVAQVTVDAKGRVTSVTDVAITGAAPTGAAGGDLSGNYPNPNVATVGGVTAANVALGVAAANAATDANTASTIVKRDAAGNFSAGTITANLTGDVTGNVSGNAGTATALQTARTINGVSFDGTSNINITAAPSGAAGGDLTGTYPNPTLTTTGVTAGTYGTATSIPAVTVDAKGRVTGVTTNAISGLAPSSLSLTDGKIFVGDGSNAASEQTMSGDATISNTGALTLANSGVTAGSYGNATSIPAVTVDAKGRITGVTTNAISGLAPSSLSLTDGKIFVGDGSNAASEQTMSGDATISNTGALTLANSGATAGTYGNATTIPAVTVDAKGRVTSVTTNAISGLAPSSLSLTDGKIFVGDGSNAASEQTMSGDATISNTGALTLANSGATAGTYGTATSIPAVTVDAKGRVTSVTTNAISGLAPSSLSLTNGKIFVGDGSNAASEQTMSGDATISNTGALTLANSGATAGTYGSGTSVAQVTVDAKGRVTSVTDVTITGAAPTGAAGGDLSGNYPNPNVATVGGVTAANVATGVNAANAATNLNTASTIVKRDASGNFSAGTITANLTGNVTGDVTGNVTGNVSGSASTFTGNLTGDVTSVGMATTIANLAVTDAKINDVSWSKITGAPTSMTPSGSAGGDLSGTYPNPNVATVGGVTAANVATGVNAANAATNLNTASTIVKRDASGNFSAGTITANLTGNVTGDVTGNVTGNVSGSASTFTGNLTGDVTSVGMATTIANLAVTDAKINDVSWSKITGAPTSMTPSGSAGGDLGGTYPNPNVATVGGVTAANVATGVNAANAATNLNTASTIVKRDASGNFSAGTITANLTGNVTGNVSGSASTFTGNLTGDVTSVGMATTIANLAVTDAKINDVSWSKITGAPTSMTPSGSAGGDLTGTYPNPTLTTTGVSAASYGSSSQIPTFTVDTKGRLTAAGTTSISGLSATSVSLADGKILIGDGTNTSAAQTMSGDVTMTNTGVTTIGSGKVTSAKIADNEIMDADVNSSAAIAGTKISPNFGAQAVTTSGNISTTGTGSITAAGNLVASSAVRFHQRNDATAATVALAATDYYVKLTNAATTGFSFPAPLGGGQQVMVTNATGAALTTGDAAIPNGETWQFIFDGSTWKFIQ